MHSRKQKQYTLEIRNNTQQKTETIQTRIQKQYTLENKNNTHQKTEPIYT